MFRAIPLVAALAVLFVACGGDASAPTPLATATPSAADRAYTEIQAAVSQALPVFTSLITLDLYNFDASNSAVNQAFADLKVNCGHPPILSGVTVDLTPRAYGDFLASAKITCWFVNQLTDTPSQSSSWQAISRSLRASLEVLRTHFDKLPDYSEAQLRRAIKERQ